MIATKLFTVTEQTESPKINFEVEENILRYQSPLFEQQTHSHFNSHPDKQVSRCRTLKLGLDLVTSREKVESRQLL